MNQWRIGLGELAILLALGTAPADVGAASNAASPGSPANLESRAKALAEANAAVVGLRAVAVSNARSIETLGRERQGSGVVIGADGLVLTIGYLVLEAEEVDLMLAGERTVPARVVAYDPASGFGLVQALTPLNLVPVRFGQSARLSTQEPLMIASGGEDGDLSLARMVSRRDFSGYWEYHIEGALFTAPPRGDHSGASLFNSEGELMGIGSLIVGDALGPGQPRLPGNMFVPIDLLKPIIGELREHGSTRQSRRAWLGVNCVEQAGQLRVLRVSRGSPAETAGLEVGDQIVRIDDTPVSALQPFYQALWRGGGPEREVTLEIRRRGEAQTIRLQAVDRMKMLRHTQGI